MSIFSDAGADAGKYLDQANNDIQKGYQPYIDQGQASLPTLVGQYSRMISNPTSYEDEWGKNYKQSPGLKFSMQQATNAANRVASAGGNVGSPSEQAAVAGQIQGMSQKDYNDYLTRAYQMFSGGLSGEQGFYDTGFKASDESATNQAQIAMSKANLAYANDKDKNAQMGGLIGNLLGSDVASGAQAFGL